MQTESEIIKGLREGREEAAEALVQCFGDRMFRVAMAVTGDPLLAEEAVQDALMQVCRKIHTFAEQASLHTWVCRVTLNTARNRVRGGWFRRVTVRDRSDWENSVSVRPDCDPVKAAVQNETFAEVRAGLQALPEKYRNTLVLYYLEDMSIKDISRVLGRPEGSVKSWLHRGRALLKDELSKGEVF